MSTQLETTANVKRAIASAALCALLAACNSNQDTQAVTTAVAADAPVLSIPIQRHGQWIVEARDADNKPHPVLLDTGATVNLLAAQGPLAATRITPEAEAAFLKRGMLNIPSDGGAVTVSTSSDDTQRKLGLTPALHIQDWAMPNDVPALQVDMVRLSSVSNTPFEGIIGNETLRRLTWRADYVAGKLTAYAGAAPAHEWQQCTFMTLNTEGRSPIIELRLDDESNFFVVDTGDDGTISLPQELFDNLARAKKFERMGTGFSYDATNRFTPMQTGLLAGLAIGQKALPKLDVVGGSSAPRIGMGLLEKMDRFELDFRDYRFCFDLPATPKDSTLTNTTSALLRRGDGYEVLALLPGNRLAQSGVKVGDQITKVDQISVKTLSLAQLRELLDNPATGELTLQRDNSPWVIPFKKLKPASQEN